MEKNASPKLWWLYGRVHRFISFGTNTDIIMGNGLISLHSLKVENEKICSVCRLIWIFKVYFKDYGENIFPVSHVLLILVLYFFLLTGVVLLHFLALVNFTRWNSEKCLLTCNCDLEKTWSKHGQFCLQATKNVGGGVVEPTATGFCVFTCTLYSLCANYNH